MKKIQKVNTTDYYWISVIAWRICFWKISTVILTKFSCLSTYFLSVYLSYTLEKEKRRDQIWEKMELFIRFQLSDQPLPSPSLLQSDHPLPFKWGNAMQCTGHIMRVSFECHNNVRHTWLTKGTVQNGTEGKRTGSSSHQLTRLDSIRWLIGNTKLRHVCVAVQSTLMTMI